MRLSPGRLLGLWLLAALPLLAAPHRDNGGFQAGSFRFTIPARWMPQPPATPARVGQWLVSGRGGTEGTVVALYFGPGKGGDTKQSLADWIGTMFNAEGHPAAAEVKNREKNGTKISQVVVFGTYTEPVFRAGFPPVTRPGYGLVGTVVESAQGSVYWRFTGPESLITANLAQFNQTIDSVRPK